MKIALLGDVHANLPALEAVLDAARLEGVDRIVHTGDLVGFGPFPRETVRAIASRGIEGVRGNFDEASAFDFDLPCPALPGDAGTAERVAILRWTQQALDFPTREALRDLPFERRVQCMGRTLAVYHANPSDTFTPVSETLPAWVLEETAREARADIVVVGHTHRPFHRIASGVHIVNAGSVGLPLDGDPRAHLAILELNGQFRVEFRRIPYDADRTAGAVRAAGLPGALSDCYITGRASWLG